MKFCEIGGPRTGTRSLNVAMKQLGFKVQHGTSRLRKNDKNDLLKKLLFGKTDLNIYYKNDYVGNVPFVHWEILAENHKDLKFILPIRDIDSWWLSVRRRWWNARRARAKGILNTGIVGSRDQFISLLISFKFFGSVGCNEYVWKKQFSRHNEEVIKYFENDDRLLVFNIFEGDSWEKLCDFVGVSEIPTNDFPSIRWKK